MKTSDPLVDSPPYLYEDPALRAVLDDVLRPGGLALTDEALAACSLPHGARVVDVGCGVGATVAHLRSHHGLDAVGIDASTMLLECGHTRAPALPLIQARGEHLPLADGALDAVFAECSLSLMRDMDAALGEFRRVLKPGGHLLLADLYVRNPAGAPLPRTVPPISCLHGALTMPQLEERLDAQGFDLLTWQDRSDAMKVLAARLIFAGISPTRFWGGTCDEPGDAIARLRPGYYWLIASKRA